MAGGRPSKYTPELITKAYEYLKNYESEGDVIPSHIGLSLYLEISTTCMYDWAKHEDKEEFSDILEKINKTQHQILISKGLTGDFNSNITKLVLGKHGYHEKQETKHSGNLGLTDMSEDELDRKIQELEQKANQDGE